ncbi:hypothetical protein MHK_004047 [Candidatus Magnetomorum sp. HK-1]|nr:hypothetical protein MHK_004047 [Candidatus Magnetomorum sp. HK-1]
MLSIRNQQIETIKSSKKQHFIQKAIKFLKHRYPQKTDKYDENILTSIIESGIDRANVYQIVSEQGIISFLELMFALSFNFDANQRTSWTRNILDNNKLTESEKIMTIINTLSRL